MLRTALPRLIAAAVLPLAIAGCETDTMAEAANGAITAAAAAAQPPLGQELYRMFQNEKASAGVAELPAQF